MAAKAQGAVSLSLTEQTQELLSQRLGTSVHTLCAKSLKKRRRKLRRKRQTVDTNRDNEDSNEGERKDMVDTSWDEQVQLVSARRKGLETVQRLRTEKWDHCLQAISYRLAQARLTLQDLHEEEASTVSPTHTSAQHPLEHQTVLELQAAVARARSLQAIRHMKLYDTPRVPTILGSEDPRETTPTQPGSEDPQETTFQEHVSISNSPESLSTTLAPAPPPSVSVVTPAPPPSINQMVLPAPPPSVTSHAQAPPPSATLPTAVSPPSVNLVISHTATVTSYTPAPPPPLTSLLAGPSPLVSLVAPPTTAPASPITSQTPAPPPSVTSYIPAPPPSLDVNSLPASPPSLDVSSFPDHIEQAPPPSLGVTSLPDHIEPAPPPSLGVTSLPDRIEDTLDFDHNCNISVVMTTEVSTTSLLPPSVVPPEEPLSMPITFMPPEPTLTPYLSDFHRTLDGDTPIHVGMEVICHGEALASSITEDSDVMVESSGGIAHIPTVQEPLPPQPLLPPSPPTQRKRSRTPGSKTRRRSKIGTHRKRHGKGTVNSVAVKSVSPVENGVAFLEEKRLETTKPEVRGGNKRPSISEDELRLEATEDIKKSEDALDVTENRRPEDTQGDRTSEDAQGDRTSEDAQGDRMPEVSDTDTDSDSQMRKLLQVLERAPYNLRVPQKNSGECVRYSFTNGVSVTAVKKKRKKSSTPRLK